MIAMSTLRSLAIFICIAVLSVSEAHARDLMDLTGVNSSIDRSAAHLQSLVTSAREAAFALEYQTNLDVKSRLNDIDSIIDDLFDDIDMLQEKTAKNIDLIIDKYLKRISVLEKEIFNDLVKAIDHAECSIDKTLTQHLQDALGGLGRLSDTNSFILTPPLMYEGEQECGMITCDVPRQKFDIDSVDFANTYKSVRDYLNRRLQNSRDDTPIASILRTYGIIANMARRAGCLTNLQKDYAAEAAPYLARIDLWERVTGERGGIVPP